MAETKLETAPESAAAAENRLAALAKRMEKLSGAFKSFGSSVGEAVGKPVEALKELTDRLTKLPESIEKISSAFSGLKEGKLSISGVSDAIAEAVRIAETASMAAGGLGKALSALSNPVAAAMAALGGLYLANEEFRESINAFLGTAAASLQPLLQTLMKILPTLADMTMGLVNVLASSLTPVVQQLAPILNGILQALVPVLDAVMQSAGQILPLLAETMAPVADVLLLLLDSILPPLMEPIRLLADLLTGPLGTAFQTVATLAGSVLLPALDAVKSFVEFLCKLFANDLDGAASAGLDLIKKFANGVIRLFAGLIQIILNGVAGFANFFINIINGVIKGLNWIPGVNIKLIEKVDLSHVTDSWRLPGMARGGVASGPTVAVVGEGRYPEAVVPLGSSPQFAGMKADIAAAVVAGLAGLTRQGGAPASGGPAEIVINVDGDKLARVVIPAIDREYRRKGMSAKLRSV